MCAVRAQKLEIVQVLVEAGADVNAISRHGGTALILAALPQSADIFQYLIQLTSQDIRQYSIEQALLMSASDGDPEVVNLLLEADVNLDTRDKSDGSIALMTATEFRNILFARTLISRGANVDIEDCQGRTALMIAARFRNLIEARRREHWEAQTNATRLLLEAKASLEKADQKGRTALMHASEFGSPQVVEILLKNGANVHTRDNINKSALTYAEGSKALIAKDKARREEVIGILRSGL